MLHVDIIKLVIITLGEVRMEFNKLSIGLPWHIIPFKRVDKLQDLGTGKK